MRQLFCIYTGEGSTPHGFRSLCRKKGGSPGPGLCSGGDKTVLVLLTSQKPSDSLGRSVLRKGFI